MKGHTMVNKNWTFEQVKAANDEALKINPERINDPTLPIYQWASLQQLAEYEEYFKSDSYWLMTAIRVCANHDLPLPEWAAKAYIKAYDAVNNGSAKSWSTVFGNPFPKGMHLAAYRKRRTYRFAVWNEVTKMRQMNPDVAIDEGLFEKIGKQFNIGKTLAAEYYYDTKKQMGF